MQTTVRVSVETRDRLAHIAAEDLGGSSLEQALKAVLFQYESLKAIAALERDPDVLVDYQHEAKEWAELDA